MPKETAKSSKPATKAKAPAKAPVKAPAKAAAKKGVAKPQAGQACRSRRRQRPAEPAKPPRPRRRWRRFRKKPPIQSKEPMKPVAPTPPPVAHPEAKPVATKKAEPKGKKGRTPPPEMPRAQAPVDLETKRTRLKNLITLGKERGFLTYAEINDHLPDDLVDAEQIESIISHLQRHGHPGVRRGAGRRDMLLAEAAPARSTQQEVEEEAEQALSTVDSEFGRTTDPVRMYMREMGSVELLTREGEIEIAKRIEDGLKHMVHGDFRLPDDHRRDPRDRRQGGARRNAHRRTGRRPDRPERHRRRHRGAGRRRRSERSKRTKPRTRTKTAAAQISASLLQLKQDALERFSIIHHLCAKMMTALAKKGSQDKGYLRIQKQISDELMNIRFTARIDRAPVRLGARHGRGGAQPRAQDPASVRRQGAHAAPAFHQGVPRQRDQPASGSSTRCSRASPTPPS